MAEQQKENLLKALSEYLEADPEMRSLLLVCDRFGGGNDDNEIFHGVLRSKHQITDTLTGANSHRVDSIVGVLKMIGKFSEHFSGHLRAHIESEAATLEKLLELKRDFLNEQSKNDLD
jgi:hypothetical protein